MAEENIKIEENINNEENSKVDDKKAEDTKIDDTKADDKKDLITISKNDYNARLKRERDDALKLAKEEQNKINKEKLTLEERLNLLEQERIKDKEQKELLTISNQLIKSGINLPDDYLELKAKKILAKKDFNIEDEIKLLQEEQGIYFNKSNNSNVNVGFTPNVNKSDKTGLNTFLDKFKKENGIL